MKYDPKKIEPQWQKQWAKEGIYKTLAESAKPKRYVLDMFPYPSGEGLHVGHPKGYIGSDIYSRFERMRGHNVLHPMGWDAFGLPAENFAIKHKIHPRVAVEKNIARYKEQLSLLGFDYDWSREVNTTDPNYYRWTQWIFLKLLDKGLAYESFEPINWCPSCQTGLANEDVEGGRCERCGTVVELRPMRQWLLRITQYADRLLKDLDTLDWPESVKESQRNWIGRREGALIKFALTNVPGQKDVEHQVEIFTTRADTIFGATFIAISPELAQKWLGVGWQASADVKKFIEQTLAERATVGHDEVKEKVGVATGIFAINPANQERIPVWIVNYVLGDVGTGAIMAVPAHDERDREFAEKFSLLIKDAPLVPSEEILKKVEGKKHITYKLKDWVFSRQRYWGEPIPVVHCEQDGVVPVAEKDLPVTLPEVKNYAPTGTGESPLADIKEWVNTTCPQCGGPAKRETNTMPQWAGSSWYYLAYITKDPKTNTLPDRQAGYSLKPKTSFDYWLPVDMYIGGVEHATRHLIYARFWHKFLYDLGIVGTPEPFQRLKNQGLILGSDGRKMSKRYGNVVNPDEVVGLYGADTFRLYEMFMGPFEQGATWNPESIIGCRRFLEQVWRVGLALEHGGNGVVTAPALYQLLHQTIKKVTADITAFKFNTVVSSLMIFINEVREQPLSREDFLQFLQLLAPLAPHITEEWWHRFGGEGSIHVSSWPEVDESVIKTTTVTLIVQINGKVRDQIEVAPDASQDEVVALALTRPTVIRWLESRAPTKVIYVPGRVLNLLT